MSNANLFLGCISFTLLDFEMDFILQTNNVDFNATLYFAHIFLEGLNNSFKQLESINKK